MQRFGLRQALTVVLCSFATLTLIPWAVDGARAPRTGLVITGVPVALLLGALAGYASSSRDLLALPDDVETDGFSTDGVKTDGVKTDGVETDGAGSQDVAAVDVAPTAGLSPYVAPCRLSRAMLWREGSLGRSGGLEARPFRRETPVRHLRLVVPGPREVTSSSAQPAAMPWSVPATDPTRKIAALHLVDGDGS
jgi:hypothetical protein